MCYECGIVPLIVDFHSKAGSKDSLELVELSKYFDLELVELSNYSVFPSQI
jgi:hypothetical protein